MSRFSREIPHRRHNLLTDEWVLVSPHRTRRPWQGKVESSAQIIRPQYDPTCYLCPGNDRAGGHKNPAYESTFVFENDFAALLPYTSVGNAENEKLLQVDSVVGICRVVCFSPRHDLSLAEMQEENIRKIVDLWADQIEELGKEYTWVQIFENKGEIMGCSNPHPHGQIWASNSLPNELVKENREQLKYYQKQNSVLLLDYLERERLTKERIVVENQHWMVVVPFWAVWPFETLLLPKRHVLRLSDLKKSERNSLAGILKRHLIRYDNLFETSFPYSMGWHGAPTDAEDYRHWQLHAHFYPPLLRSATVKKFIVGYEMLAEVQRDITPEQAAKRLQELSEIHYRKTVE